MPFFQKPVRYPVLMSVTNHLKHDKAASCFARCGKLRNRSHVGARKIPYSQDSCPDAVGLLSYIGRTAVLAI